MGLQAERARQLQVLAFRLDLYQRHRRMRLAVVVGEFRGHAAAVPDDAQRERPITSPGDQRLMIRDVRQILGSSEQSLEN